MAKFEVGDIIRIEDKEDIAYDMMHFYKITFIDDSGYYIKSLQTGKVHEPEHLKMLKNTVDVFSFIDTYYRLATKEEKILYVRE